MKLISDWFGTSKTIKKLFGASYADKNMLFLNTDSGDVVFNCSEMVILNIDLNNINLDNDFDEENPDTIIYVRLLAWHFRFKKRKTFKK